MATERAVTHRQRGRPRTRPVPSGLVRRNLLVDPEALRELKELYGSTSESEAVRRAVDLALLANAAQVLSEKLAARGGPVDVYGPPPPLPVYLKPGEIDSDDEDLA